MNETPLFVPLRKEFYEAFLLGTKQMELRRYGPRWNERTCVVGRAVTLSQGYGRRHRHAARLVKFERRPWADLNLVTQRTLQRLYGPGGFDVACLTLELV